MGDPALEIAEHLVASVYPSQRTTNPLSNPLPQRLSVPCRRFPVHRSSLFLARAAVVPARVAVGLYPPQNGKGSARRARPYVFTVWFCPTCPVPRAKSLGRNTQFLAGWHRKERRNGQAAGLAQACEPCKWQVTTGERMLFPHACSAPELGVNVCPLRCGGAHSTVTDLAKFLGLSTSVPRATAV